MTEGGSTAGPPLRRRDSLRWQIAAGLAVLAAVVIGLSALASHVATSRQLADVIDEAMLASANAANNSRTPDKRGGPGGGDGDRDGPPRPPPVGREPGRYGVCPLAGALQPAAAAQLVDEDDGEIVACIEGGPTLPISARGIAIGQGAGGTELRTVSIDGRSYRLLTVEWHHGGALQIARDLGETEQVLGTLRLQNGLLALAGAAVAALAGWWLAGRLVRPVQRLRHAAEHVAATQDLSIGVPVEGRGEIGSLAASFTTMVGALASSREQQRRLISDASHELRTPLTSLRTNVDHLRHVDRLPAEERQQVLDDIGFELVELTELVSELVELATDRASDEEPEPLDLLDVVAPVAARAERRTGRTVEIVTSDATGPTTVLARPQMVERAVANLLDNALKYSPSPEPVRVRVDGGTVEVTDHGPGIDPADQPFVFDRFYRAVSARTAPGSGLGLAIVAQVVDRHGGRVWAGNAPEGGARVGFELPLLPTSSPPSAPSSPPSPGTETSAGPRYARGGTNSGE